MDEQVADLLGRIRSDRTRQTESDYSSQPPSPVDRRRCRSSSDNRSVDDTEDDSTMYCLSMERAFDRAAVIGIGAQSLAVDVDDDDGLRQISAGDVTSSYRKRRLKNNEAARKSREKRRRLDAELRRQLELVIAENQSLRYELRLLRTACGLSTADDDVTSVSPTVSAAQSVLSQSWRHNTTSPVVEHVQPTPPPSALSPILSTPASRCVKSESVASEDLVAATSSGCDSRLLRRAGGGRSPTDVGTVGNSFVRFVPAPPSIGGGVGRLVAGAAGLGAYSADRRLVLATSLGFGAVDVVDRSVTRTIGADGSPVESMFPMGAFRDNAEPLNLSTSAGAATKRMLCV